MTESMTYTVAGMTCAHCEHAVSGELAAVPGVQAVVVDLEGKLVTVTGADLAVEAMTCASCVARIEKRLNRLAAASTVFSSVVVVSNWLRLRRVRALEPGT